jgi:hypothetical protein
MALAGAHLGNRNARKHGTYAGKAIALQKKLQNWRGALAGWPR